MTTQTHSAAELEELLAEEIPCGGIRNISPPCGRPAILRAHKGHEGCTEDFSHPAAYKCVQCWQTLVYAPRGNHCAGRWSPLLLLQGPMYES